MNSKSYLQLNSGLAIYSSGEVSIREASRPFVTVITVYKRLCLLKSNVASIHICNVQKTLQIPARSLFNLNFGSGSLMGRNLVHYCLWIRSKNIFRSEPETRTRPDPARFGSVGRTDGGGARVVMHGFSPHNKANMWEPQGPNMLMRRLYLYKYSQKSPTMWDYCHSFFFPSSLPNNKPKAPNYSLKILQQSPPIFKIKG